MTVVEGDNIEFTAVDIDDYIIWFSRDQGDYTDTATTKYPADGNAVSATKFCIRADKSIDLLGINNKTFTDPCQITADKAHVETRGAIGASWIKLRTNSTNTMIKIRWF